MGSVPDNQPLSEIRGRKLKRPAGIGYEYLKSTYSNDTSKIAIVCMDQAADLYSAISKSTPTAKYLRWNFDEFFRVSHAMAIALAEAGIRPGMTIAVFSENAIETHIMFRAALELNCTLVMLNPQSTSNERDAKHFLNLTKPNVIMVPNAEHARKLERSAQQEV